MTPVFCKPRPVPYAMRLRLEIELERLMKEGIIEQVTSSDWATPIVPIPKSNGNLRVCGDYKITLNPNLVIDRHPISRVSDLLVKLEKGKFFPKLDLEQAYQQIELVDSSKDLTTISTHKGLFRFNRLSYGIASAPSLFQREMEKILDYKEGTVVYFDDVLVSGRTRDEHDKNVREVLNCFKSNGLTLKLGKCHFAKTSIQFLEYELDETGLHISKERIQAIVDMKTLENIPELQSFLGAINFCSRFIRNFAQVVNPLYELLEKDVKWQWTRDCKEA